MDHHDDMTLTYDDLAEEPIRNYRELSKHPSLLDGLLSFETGAITVTSRWSQSDLDRNEKHNFTREHVLNKECLAVISKSRPVVHQKSLWDVPSNIDDRTMKVWKVEKDDKNSEEKCYFEVWTRTGCERTYEVSASEKHGPVYDDDATFGSLVWSPKGDKVAYIAEKKRPKSISYFDKVSVKDKGSTRGDKFSFRDDWGEQLVAKCHPVVCILDLASGEVSVISDGLDDVSCGQVVWSPCGQSVVFCAFFHNPIRLGVIYCPQRRSVMYQYTIATGHLEVIVGKENNSVRSPRFSPDGEMLAYLECSSGGPHHKCLKLMICDWSTKSHRTLVDIVKRPCDDFCGLYSAYLTSRCWSSDSRHIIIHTPVRSRQDIFAVNSSTGQLTRLTEEAACWTLLDVCEDILLVAQSRMDRVTCLAVARLELSGSGSVVWSYPDGPIKPLLGIKWSIVKHVPLKDNASYARLEYESILLEPTKRKSEGLVVCPHGGPHSSFTIDFLLFLAAVVQCGFTVILVNYRGSTGFGEDSISSLLGHIGEQDVADVQQAAEEVILKYNMNKNRVVVVGGSHGGFLTAHLIGQYPDFYKAAVMRNPVTNLVAMLSCTDIPDWGFVESDLEYSLGAVAKEKDYAKLHSLSPIFHIDKVKTPTLIMLGMSDRRVPTSLGTQYHKALLSRGVPTRLLAYPDNNHSIHTVEAASDSFVHLLVWFKMYINS